LPNNGAQQEGGHGQESNSGHGGEQGHKANQPFIPKEKWDDLTGDEKRLFINMTNNDKREFVRRVGLPVAAKASH
jgi:hypothetical protein